MASQSEPGVLPSRETGPTKIWEKDFTDVDVQPCWFRAERERTRRYAQLASTASLYSKQRRGRAGRPRPAIPPLPGLTPPPPPPTRGRGVREVFEGQAAQVAARDGERTLSMPATVNNGGASGTVLTQTTDALLAELLRQPPPEPNWSQRLRTSQTFATVPESGWKCLWARLVSVVLSVGVLGVIGAWSIFAFRSLATMYWQAGVCAFTGLAVTLFVAVAQHSVEQRDSMVGSVFGTWIGSAAVFVWLGSCFLRLGLIHDWSSLSDAKVWLLSVLSHVSEVDLALAGVFAAELFLAMLWLVSRSR